MSFLLNWLTGKPAAPQRVPTDTVIPLHFWDGHKTNQSMVIDMCLRFDDVLDVQGLVGALERLLERPGWRKLGARLRMKPDKSLEYHIPAAYTPTRPSINHTHTTYASCISSHSLGALLQRPTGDSRIYISDSSAKLCPLILPEKTPRELNDFIYTDRAQLSVHVVSFEDATLVTLTWMHTLLDAMGRSMLLRAWTAMLEGRESDVPEFWGYDEDPLVRLGEPVGGATDAGKEHTSEVQVKDDGDGESGGKQQVAREEHVLSHRQIRGWSFFRFVLSFVWDQLLHRTEESRHIMLPASVFARLKRDALSDLTSIPTSELTLDTRTNTPIPFLSDGDILCAWFTRLLISSQPWVSTASPSKTIQVMNIFGMRDLVSCTPPVLIPKGVAFIGNATMAISSFFSLHDFLAWPLGRVAARIRKDLTIQSTRAQVDVAARAAAQSMRHAGRPPLYGDADMAFSAFSNWTRAKMFETDFSAAVYREGKKGGRKGLPSQVYLHGTTKNFSVRNSGPCVGRDGEGNWWLQGTLTLEAWRNVERALGEYNGGAAE